MLTKGHVGILGTFSMAMSRCVDRPSRRCSCCKISLVCYPSSPILEATSLQSPAAPTRWILRSLPDFDFPNHNISTLDFFSIAGLFRCCSTLLHPLATILQPSVRISCDLKFDNRSSLFALRCYLSESVFAFSFPLLQAREWGIVNLKHFRFSKIFMTPNGGRTEHSWCRLTTYAARENLSITFIARLIRCHTHQKFCRKNPKFFCYRSHHSLSLTPHLNISQQQWVWIRLSRSRSGSMTGK